MSDLKNYLKEIDKKISDLTDICWELTSEWDGLLDGIVELRWDCDQFKKTVFKTYEYFKSLYERSNILEENYYRMPLDSSELKIISMVYAYGRAESLCFIPIEDDYERYASYFIAQALHSTIVTSHLRPWTDQEFYTVKDEFMYCSPDGDGFEFKYNVKTGNMTEIVDLLKLFVDSGWLQ